MYHLRVLNCVKVMDYNNICIVGGNKTNDSIQTIHVSHNAGNSWTTVSDNIMPWLTSISFPSSGTGIAVGDYGKIIKTVNTGDTWTTVSVPASLNFRHFNSVFFTSYLTGYVVGGNTPDGFTTILKTTNGGDSWEIKKNEQGKTLNSVYFYNQSDGLAVGIQGIVYKTINNGDTWEQVHINGTAGTRNYRSVFFINNQIGFIAGGEDVNDTIQTLLKTTDGGSTWEIVFDRHGNQLNAIMFVNENAGYAAGNNGTLLQTNDGGTTWEEVILPQNDYSRHLLSIHFMNLDYGYVTGTGGVCYRYYNAQGHTPTAITNTASDFHSGNITLNGSVNANGYATNVVFEYGVSTNYTHSVQASLPVVSGTLTNQVKAVLSSLTPYTLYHYRIKATNAMGTTTGSDSQFFTGYSNIPNFSFENWDSSIVAFPDGYSRVGGNVSKSGNACHGNYAILMKNDSSAQKPAGILMGESEDALNFYGGKPFTSRPDSVKGCFDYLIAPGDSAFVLLIFKKNSQIISENYYYITGSSNGIFEDKSFPVNFSSFENPDTVIFGVSITTFIANDSVIPGNYVALDYIRFTGTTENLPNYDFEDWPEYDIILLNNWNYDRKDAPAEPNHLNQYTVSISEIYHDGYYSARINHFISPNDTVSAYIQSESFPIGYIPHKLTGYHLFQQSGIDTLVVSINLFYQGQTIGSGTYKTTESTSWFTPFEADIQYNSAVICDSACIRISLASSSILTNQTYALIDDLNFDSYLLQIKDEPSENYKSKEEYILVFPNPVRDILKIQIDNSLQEEYWLTVTDIYGKIMISEKKSVCRNTNQSEINVQNLKNGFYFVIISGKDCQFIKKIIVRH
jgi:photosystem II stability/assembly factor-like uncharacterized protein